jgi:hypothetical protein
MSDSIIHPLHYLIVRREGTTWYFSSGDSVFYNPRNVPVSLSLEDRLHRFGLTMAKVAIELFRINGGRAGYYLTNLRTKEYYYCGKQFEHIKITLQSLGIGRSEPQR